MRLRVELWEQGEAGRRHDRGKQADLCGFLRTDEIAPGLARDRKRLPPRIRKLCSRLPFENATLAKRAAVAASKSPPAPNSTCSIKRLLAPIRLVGFAALS